MNAVVRVYCAKGQQNTEPPHSALVTMNYVFKKYLYQRIALFDTSVKSLFVLIQKINKKKKITKIFIKWIISFRFTWNNFKGDKIRYTIATRHM